MCIYIYTHRHVKYQYKHIYIYEYVCVYIYIYINVAALLVIWASLMRFFSLFKPGPKTMTGSKMRFFFGGGGLGVGFLLCANGQS